MEVQEGQRARPVHARETLGAVDSGIAPYRNMLLDALRDIKEGRDPPNVWREKDANRMIETGCWNTVTGAEE